MNGVKFILKGVFALVCDLLAVVLMLPLAEAISAHLLAVPAIKQLYDVLISYIGRIFIIF